LLLWGGILALKPALVKGFDDFVKGVFFLIWIMYSTWIRVLRINLSTGVVQANFSFSLVRARLKVDRSILSKRSSIAALVDLKMAISSLADALN
jgi:hypothetical protein